MAKKRNAQIKISERDLGGLKDVLAKREAKARPVVREYPVLGLNFKTDKYETIGFFDAQNREEAIAKAKRSLGAKRSRFKQFITGAQRLNPSMKKRTSKTRKVAKKKNLSLFTSRKRAAAKAAKLREKAKRLEAHSKRPTLRQKAGAKAHKLITKLTGNPRRGSRAKKQVSARLVDAESYLKMLKKMGATKERILEAQATLNDLYEKQVKQVVARKKPNPPKRRNSTYIKARKVTIVRKGNPKGIPASDRLNKLWGRLAARFDETYPSEADILKRATPAERKLFKKLKAVAKQEPGHSRNPRRGTRHMATARKLSRSKDANTRKTGKALLKSKTRGLRAKRRNGQTAADAMRQTFVGRKVAKHPVMIAANGTPKKVAALGKLTCIQLRGHRPLEFNEKEAPMLAINPEGDHLYIIGGKGKFAKGARGKLEKIGYLARKTHLPNGDRTFDYRHRFDTAPDFSVDAEGFGKISKARYIVTAAGIEG